MTEDKSQPVTHTLRFHGNPYDAETFKTSETALETIVKLIFFLNFLSELVFLFVKDIFVCENIAALAQSAHRLKHHVYHMFCHAQQKVKLIDVLLCSFLKRSTFVVQVAELQALNPTAEPTELISAICGDTHWLQEVRQEKRREERNEFFSLIFF